MRILIIDDYKSHGESLAELVQVLGHEAQYAASYTEAEWLLGLFSFDVALLDFDMPTMTGAHVARKLRRDYSHIHPVIMSARTLEKESPRELVGLTVLQKPLSREILEELFANTVRARSGPGLMLRASFPILKVPSADDPDAEEDDEARSGA